MEGESLPEQNAENLQKWKVAELKSKLSELGLPLDGNKPQLIKRLQKALNQSDELGTSAEEDSFHDDSINLEDSTQELGSSQEEESPLKESYIFEQESTNDQSPTHGENTNNTEQPTQVSTFVSRKIKLPKTVPKASTETIASRNIAVTQAAKVEAASETKITKIEPPQRDLTDAEKLANRAKRFNIVTAPESASKSGKTVITAKKVIAKVPVKSSKVPAKALKVVSEADLAQLKKRAERFGENVSPVMSKLEAEEKKKSRLIKFSAELSSGLEADEKKKSRLIKFGGDLSSGQLEAEEKKKSRLIKFGADFLSEPPMKKPKNVEID